MAQSNAVPPPAIPIAPTPNQRGATSGDGSAAGDGVAPFGANLFLGNFLRQREDGLNPEYTVMPGDRVAVYAWGSIELNQVFIVDGQGNIFLPDIGPVRLAGVRNADLTATLDAAIRRIYRRNFSVYTNLLTAAPVAVYVTGGVRRPGRYAGVPSDSALFFLDQAGGIDASLGSYRNIVILRAGKPLATIDLYKFILSGELPQVQFTDGDTILVHGRGPVVEVRGAAAAPALLEFDKAQITGAEVLDIIPHAARATEVTVVGVRGGRPYGETMSIAQVRTASFVNGDVLEFGDDGLSDTILVHLEGEFRGNTVLSVLRGSRLVDVLNYIEVDPDLADTSAIHLRRRSVARAQKQSIENSLFRLQQSALLALSNTAVEVEIRTKEAELMQRFIDSARLIQPLGRVVIAREGELLNPRLEQGDVIVIPPYSNVIRVGGEVQMTQALLYDAKLRVRDYVELAGGYTGRADAGKAIILHADASVTSGDEDAFIRPGDEILIPPRVDRKLLQNAVDLTSVIYQIAVSAAVVLAL